MLKSSAADGCKRAGENQAAGGDGGSGMGGTGVWASVKRFAKAKVDAAFCAIEIARILKNAKPQDRFLKRLLDWQRAQCLAQMIQLIILTGALNNTIEAGDNAANPSFLWTLTRSQKLSEMCALFIRGVREKDRRLRQLKVLREADGWYFFVKSADDFLECPFVEKQYRDVVAEILHDIETGSILSIHEAFKFMPYLAGEIPTSAESGPDQKKALIGLLTRFKERPKFPAQ